MCEVIVAGYSEMVKGANQMVINHIFSRIMCENNKNAIITFLCICEYNSETTNLPKEIALMIAGYIQKTKTENCWKFSRKQ
jgi:hypothetical protein